MHGPLSSALTAWGYWAFAALPILGGLAVGLMRWYWHEFGPGIAVLIEVSKGKPTTRPLRTVPKILAAAISLGSGASLGPEGPSVEIGANIGTWIAQLLRVSQERLGLLLSAGAGAGLAAGFNAPVAGVFFALEVVLGTTFATSAVSVVLLAAVVAALITQIGLGSQPAFILPVYEVRSPLELPLYLGLGVLASLVSMTFTYTTRWARQSFRGEIPQLAVLAKIPRPLQPVLAGTIVGLVALQFPQITGVGYETIEAILRDSPFSLQLLLMLVGLKLLMTALCMGGGFVGGGFAPAMYLGACLGAAYGKVVAGLLPMVDIAAPPAYAMVGMAAVLAGSARAPLTAILLMFELTRDYRIVLPLMAAAGLSAWLVERFAPKAIAPQDAKLLPMGVDMNQEPRQEVLSRITVAEAMGQPPIILSGSLSILRAGQLLLQHHQRSALIANEHQHIIGTVTLQDINQLLAQLAPTVRDESPSQTAYLASIAHRTIGELFQGDLVYVHATDTLAEALKRMSTRGLRQLPVLGAVHSADPSAVSELSPSGEPLLPNQVLGVIDQDAVDLACGMAIAQGVFRPYLDVVATSIAPPTVPVATATTSSAAALPTTATATPQAVSQPATQTLQEAA